MHAAVSGTGAWQQGDGAVCVGARPTGVLVPPLLVQGDGGTHLRSSDESVSLMSLRPTCISSIVLMPAA